MPDPARKDDRSQATQASPPTPQFRPRDLDRAAEVLTQQTTLVRQAVEAYEKAKELPPEALNFKVSL